ncbi:Gfo/Idh/MocA family protein [Rhodopila globiformis]|uniref:Oxidoreductase n=1 Tax=Rhodopila globiformis TaxID=1071 RepID=A0A2S6N0L6_RHOGL|nr:Gfo/Idh/MocA family oxidoreductase [Rhodopila globiformis]PPQ28139.1 oxidoreductase [Rhodopila globiformis]
MTEHPVRLAVIGAGAIGRRHIAHVLAEDCAELIAIVDPAPEAQALAAGMSVAWYPDFAAMMTHEPPDGVIIATPNRTHVALGLEAVQAGLPALIEKPIGDDVAPAARLVEAAEKAGVDLLVGHHRRHNPLVRAAKGTIEAGRLGRLVAAHATYWVHKPDAYFTVAWRREAGAGPVLLNLIHDVDLLRYLCGEVVSVQAMESNARRGHPVEDTAVILLRFASGVLGTMTVSDTIVSPWGWDVTAGENAAFPRTAESCHFIGGTQGSLTIPHLDVWHSKTRPDWLEPVEAECLAVVAADPLALQVRNLCDVVRGAAQPVVSGREGLATLKVVAGIKQAAATGQVVTV